MKQSRIIIIAGGIVAGLALFLLAYNLIDLYSIVGRCAPATNTQLCGTQQMRNWHVLNVVGLAALGIGLVLLIVGIIAHTRRKAA